MRAVQIQAFGGPEVLQVAEVPEPEPGEGQIRIRVAAAGVNFADTQAREGQSGAQTPFIPGAEAAGVVDAVGPGVDAFAEGDRVVYARQPGAYAEAVCVSADKAVRVPDDLDLETAASVMLQGLTAHYLSQSTHALAEGETALVHAGAGGVGLLLTQMAKRRGAQVISTTSTQAKAEVARSMGADHVVLYTETDFADEVARIVPDGVDVVYDSVGKVTWEGNLRSLRVRGTFAIFGEASGPVGPIEMKDLMGAGGIYLTRTGLAYYLRDADEFAWRIGEVLDWVRSDDLRVHRGGTYRLDQAPEAHRKLQGRETTGKILLVP